MSSELWGFPLWLVGTGTLSTLDDLSGRFPLILLGDYAHTCARTQGAAFTDLWALRTSHPVVLCQVNSSPLPLWTQLHLGPVRLGSPSGCPFPVPWLEALSRQWLGLQRARFTVSCPSEVTALCCLMSTSWKPLLYIFQVCFRWEGKIPITPSWLEAEVSGFEFWPYILFVIWSWKRYSASYPSLPTYEMGIIIPWLINGIK